MKFLLFILSCDLLPPHPLFLHIWYNGKTQCLIWEFQRICHSFHSRSLSSSLFRNLLLPAVTTKRFFQFQAKSLSIRIKKWTNERHVTHLSTRRRQHFSISLAHIKISIKIRRSMILMLPWHYLLCFISVAFHLKLN